MGSPVHLIVYVRVYYQGHESDGALCVCVCVCSWEELGFLFSHTKSPVFKAVSKLVAEPRLENFSSFKRLLILNPERDAASSILQGESASFSARSLLLKPEQGPHPHTAGSALFPQRHLP